MLLVVAFIRWRLLRFTAYPTGLDAGNWLAYGHALLGEHVRSSSLQYPPVVPLIAVAGEGLFGTYVGVQALAFAAAAAPALGTYTLLYAWGLGWRAVILAGFLAASAATGEAMAWGGYPQLIGLGLLPIFILALDRFLISHSISRAILPAILLLASFATSDLIGPMTAGVGLVYLVMRYAFLAAKREGNSGRNVLFGLGLAVLSILPLASIYLSLLPGIAANEHSKQTSPISVLSAVTAVMRDFPIFWVGGLAIATAAVLVLVVKRYRLAMLSAAILIPCLLGLTLFHEQRLVYLLPTGIIIGIGGWCEAAQRLPNWGSQSVNSALVTFLAIDILVGTQFFAIQRDYYAVLNPGLVRGLSEMTILSSPNQVIAVSPAPNDWALGWWVEGAVRRPTLYAGNPMWLNYSDEKSRNAIANQIFSWQNGMAESRLEARAAGAAFLFVDKEWSGYQSWAQHDRLTEPGSIAFENESVVIIATGA